MINLFLTALLLGNVAISDEKSPNQTLNFVELPFMEGRLFVSVHHDNRALLLKAVDVESDSIEIPIDLSDKANQKLEVKAFQDLNGNSILDVDNYGRPAEPCIQTSIIPNDSISSYELRLIQF